MIKCIHDIIVLLLFLIPIPIFKSFDFLISSRNCDWLCKNPPYVALGSCTDNLQSNNAPILIIKCVRISHAYRPLYSARATSTFTWLQ